MVATEKVLVSRKQGGREGRRGATVLVIDDDEDTRDVLSEMLDEVGYDVVVAASAREGMERLIGGLRPVVIMLDVMMPMAGGHTFRTWQRARPELAHIPILVASGASLSREALAQLSPDIRLRKPFDLHELTTAVQTLAGGGADVLGASPT